MRGEKKPGLGMLNLAQRRQERKFFVLFAVLRKDSIGFVGVQNFEPLQARCVRDAESA